MSKKMAVLLMVLALLASFHPAGAQGAGRMPRIGLLSINPAPMRQERAFLDALRGLGYVEGKNIYIEYRWAAGKLDRLPAMAEELVRLKVDVIVARATPSVQAAKNATKTIPIVMSLAADPLGSGFVASLARPGGNITGMSAMMPELAGKRLELLREIVPGLSRVAFLAYDKDPAHRLFVKQAREAAERVGIRFQPLVIGSTGEIEGAFAAMARERAEALIVHPLFINNLRQGPKIADLAVRNRLPAVSDGAPFADTGGLLFYGADTFPLFKRAAVYVDKILKGAKPADLPVEQPTRFELVINLKTAKALGITIPPEVLFQADRVIR